jgi:hypothetical protein
VVSGLIPVHRSGHPSLLKTRLDPIVSPGQVSGHVHSFGGASTIYKDLTYDGLRSSNCTTSDMADDKSVSAACDRVALMCFLIFVQLSTIGLLDSS